MVEIWSHCFSQFYLPIHSPFDAQPLCMLAGKRNGHAHLRVAKLRGGCACFVLVELADTVLCQP